LFGLVPALGYEELGSYGVVEFLVARRVHGIHLRRATGVSPAGHFHRPDVGRFGCAGASESYTFCLVSHALRGVRVFLTARVRIFPGLASFTLGQARRWGCFR
jgi:hypothetical protein